MSYKVRYFHRLFYSFLLIVFLIGCASVPKEVVELSYTLGQDLTEVHASYRKLIRTHFEFLRKQMIIYLESRWVPLFIENFVKKGNLMELANEAESSQDYKNIQAWTEAAVEKIEQKKKELLEPIENDEKKLLTLVDDAFERLGRANATITSHLNSIRKVKDLQDNILERMGLKELRDQINQGLDSASENAGKIFEK